MTYTDAMIKARETLERAQAVVDASSDQRRDAGDLALLASAYVAYATALARRQGGRA